MLAGTHLVPHTFSGRCMFISLFFSSIVIYNFYTSILVSSLISGQHQTDITDLWKLGDSELRFGAEDAPYLRVYFEVSIYMRSVVFCLRLIRCGPSFHSPFPRLRMIHRHAIYMNKNWKWIIPTIGCPYKMEWNKFKRVDLHTCARGIYHSQWWQLHFNLMKSAIQMKLVYARKHWLDSLCDQILRISKRSK